MVRIEGRNMSEYVSDDQWQELLEHFGCRICSTISLYGEHICEHGVTVCQPITISGTLTTTTDVCGLWLKNQH